MKAVYTHPLFPFFVILSVLLTGFLLYRSHADPKGTLEMPVGTDVTGPLNVEDNSAPGTERTVLTLRAKESQTGTGVGLDFAQSSAVTGRIVNHSDGPGRAGLSLYTYGNGEAPRLREHVRIDGAGNVGIGTQTPGEKLTVAGIIETTFGGIKFPDGSVQTRAATGGGGSFSLWSEGSDGSIHRVPGNVGIGTATPNSKLEISAQGDGVSVLRFTTDRPWEFRQSGSGNTAALELHSTVSSKEFKITGGDGTPVAVFQVHDNHGLMGVLLAPNGGRVGIGTTAPQSRLAVNGTITAREMVVTSQGWPDFVFEEDYSLMPLDEVEKSIQKNGHLPDIPSADEVADKGVRVGEMQSKLLLKVEELTLHMIEQNKRINRLESENETLRNRVASLEGANPK